MAKFQYTAVNSEGSTLHGVVEADDIRSAKKELNSLDLQVVDLKEIDLKTKLVKSSLNKYKFEAVNEEGKVVKGTISAIDENKAFARLVSEYKLQVNKIAHINASNKSFDDSTDKVKEKKQEQIDPSRVKSLRGILIPLMDDLKALMKHVRTDLSDQIGDASREFLDKYILHLDKIKFSDNLVNVQSVCLKICNVLEQSDLFFENGEKVDEKLRVNLMARDLDKKFKNYDTPPSRQSLVFADSKPDSLYNLIAVVFQSKSKNQRNLAIKNLLVRLKSVFRYDGEFVRPVLRGLREVSLWLFLLYGVMFVIFHFISVKAVRFEVPAIFSVYQTNILIYIVVGALIGHLSLEIVDRFVKKPLLKLVVNSMFLVLFLMICINL
jgi:uncharacterized protein (DUF2344 family)